MNGRKSLQLLHCQERQLDRCLELSDLLESEGKITNHTFLTTLYGCKKNQTRDLQSNGASLVSKNLPNWTYILGRTFSCQATFDDVTATPNSASHSAKMTNMARGPSTQKTSISLPKVETCTRTDTRHNSVLFSILY